MMYKIPAATAACRNATRSDIQIGGHEVTIDEPAERGGTGIGATPLEYLMAALAGCTNVISNRIATDMGIDIDLATVQVEGTVDSRVLQGQATEVAFPKVKLDVTVKTGADEAQIEALRERLARTCPVSVLLQQAGAEIVGTWTVLAP